MVTKSTLTVLIPDGWEVENSLDPLTDDSAEDPDSDGLSNLGEYQANTDPSNSDTDFDGMPDGWEVENSLDPLTDDSAEDPDSDSLTNLGEYQANTDPSNSDTDGDGLTDGEEVNTYGTDPLVSDTDGDGYSDGDEVNKGTDPTDSNSYPTTYTTGNSTSNSSGSTLYSLDFSSFVFFLSVLMVPVFIRLTSFFRRKQN